MLDNSKQKQPHQLPGSWRISFPLFAMSPMTAKPSWSSVNNNYNNNVKEEEEEKGDDIDNNNNNNIPSSTNRSSVLHHTTHHTTQQILDNLWSYGHSLRNRRKQKEDTRRIIQSLIRYMNEHPLLLSVKNSTTILLQLQDAMEAVMVPALRTAGEQNDYRLILQLISSCVVFANNHPVLKSRLFGEAMEALSRTDANMNKIKSVWNVALAMNEDDTGPATYRAEPLMVYELNLYLKALASRGKSKACVDAVRQFLLRDEIINDDSNKTRRTITDNVVDSYTISTLFHILTESITNDQKLCDRMDLLQEKNIITTTTTASSSSLTLFQKLAKLTSSTCWQWNAAVEILGLLPPPSTTASALYTNHFYSALLKLQIKAQKLFVEHDNGSQLTMTILDDMVQTAGVTPDIVTCTLAIIAMSQVYDDNDNETVRSSSSSHSSSSCRHRRHSHDGERNLAVEFLRLMQSPTTTLPNPNYYSYSAAIVACARRNDSITARNLLEEMRTNGIIDPSIQPNTRCYNEVLLSLDTVKKNNNKIQNWSTAGMPWKSKKKSTKNQRYYYEQEQQELTGIALSLLDQMKSDHHAFGYDTQPDTVTYNTILRVGQFPYYHQNREKETTTTHTVTAMSLLEQMSDNGIPCDVISYRNAILASTATSDGNEVLRILQKWDGSDGFVRTASRKRDENRDLASIYNTGLLVLASIADYSNFGIVLSMMDQRQISRNDETVTAVLEIMGKSTSTNVLTKTISILRGEDGRATANARGFSASETDLGNDDGSWTLALLLEKYTFPPLHDFHYAKAIEICLRRNHFSNAFIILTAMREQGIQPSTRCMESFATAYAKAATNIRPTDVVSISRAKSAYQISMALKPPTTNSIGVVAQACAKTGQWKQARSMLRVIHSNILKSKSSDNNSRESQNTRRTQSVLMRECANQGNLNAAMLYTNDIQYFSTKYYGVHRKQNETTEASIKICEHVSLDENDFFSSLRDLVRSPASGTNVGMRGQDWVSLIQTASKAGNWRVCLNSLQFLQPYVSRTKVSGEQIERSTIDQRYEQLAPALTAVLRCLESHYQDGWAIRSIQDWIKWSGRRPRAEAVLSAIRILSSNALGDEVKDIVGSCLQKGLGSCSTRKGAGYEEVILIGAVTALHQNGLYDEADEIFMSGISSRYLPFSFAKDTNGRFLLDLHGLNIALSHSSVRVAMRQHASRFADENKIPDIIVVTGRGRNSAIHLRPILRPEVQRMLMEEFYPPLNTLSVAGNIGALMVLGPDIQAWQKYQQEQKGARMMELSELLRNFCTNDQSKKSCLPLSYD